MLIIYASNAINCLSHALVQSEFQSKIEIIGFCFIYFFLITSHLIHLAVWYHLLHTHTHTVILFPPSPTRSKQKLLRVNICSLQGSAHMGPALTPVEVLVAIHHIVPEKDGLALKKASLLYFKVLVFIHEASLMFSIC